VDARRWPLLLALVLGQMGVTWPLLSINVILPQLTREFAVDVSVGSWILNASLVGLVAALLPAGRIGDRVGHVRTFLWGSGAFVVATALAAFATSYPLFLAFRMAQGVAAALVTTPAFAIPPEAFPAGQLGRAIAAVTVAANLGGVMGNLTFSVLSDSWRVAFWIPLPICLFAAWLLRRSAPVEVKREAPPVDWPGALLMLATLVVFSLSLNHLHDGPETFRDGWAWHLPMHALAALLLLILLRVERRARHPFLPLHVFRKVPFSAGLVSNGILHGIMMAGFFLLPFLVEQGYGLPPAYTAGLSISMQAMAVSLGPVSGLLYDRGYGRWLLPAAMGMVGLGMTLVALFGIGTSYWLLALFMLPLGIGLGSFWTANNAAVMAAAPGDLRGLGSGLLSTTTQLGHSVGASMSGALLGIGLSSGAGAAAMASQFRFAWLAFAAVAVVGAAVSLLERPHGRPAAAPHSAAD
jgi:MFS family permease